MSFFKIYGFLFTITLRQKPKGVLRRQRRITRQRESMRCLLGTPLGICLKLIVNKKTLNLEKTTSSVLSVILINLQPQLYNDYPSGAVGVGYREKTPATL